MKRVLCIALSVVLVIALAAVAFAADDTFTGSKTLSTESISEVKPVDASGNTVDVTIEVVADTATENTPAARKQFKQNTSPAIMITSIAQATAANEAAKGTADDATTDSGLTVAENKELVEAYEAVKECKTTEEVLEAVKVKAESLPEGVTIADYTPAAMFNIAVNDATVAAIGEDGAVELTTEIPGVAAGDEVVIIKLPAADEEEGTVLESKVNDDGKVTFKMIGSGNIMVLVNPGK